MTLRTRAMLSSLLSALTLVVSLAGCPSGKTYTGVRVIAEGIINENGGSLTAGNGVSILVPPGAVPSTVVFGIKRVDGVVLPMGLELIGDTYLLEPGGRTFATPIQVTVPVPTGATQPTDTLVLLRKPVEASEWEVIAGADGTAIKMRGAVSHFSAFAVARIVAPVASCFAPTTCDFSCAPESSFPPSSCTGSCDVRGERFEGGVHCELAPADLQNATGTKVACTCVPPEDGSRPPHRTAAHLFDAHPGALHPAQLIYDVAVWCWFPCDGERTFTDAGVQDAEALDADQTDAEQSADADVAAPDAEFADAASALDDASTPSDMSIEPDAWMSVADASTDQDASTAEDASSESDMSLEPDAR